ncbi:chloride channel protein [Bradyrhizobium vignae]|uniref:chloride channel protein n=1 Tax=Bradyrhizobium vignae TaxID=1549949 RepID=UPI001ABF2F40|nr:chloride channel protein [Bradyrhizobium vignae]
MALALLLHLIQHFAYGYSLEGITRNESFLQGVMAAAPARRVAALLSCGLVAGCGWWAVYRFGVKEVSIKDAVAPGGPPMPFLTTMAHVLLQIATVALGSPLGREVAPREIGALLAGWFSCRGGLGAGETRIMIACGAGAGLAAVYNVPLAGTVFVLEVLLRSIHPTVVIPAIVTSWIATVVARTGLGDVAQYRIPDYQISVALVVWSVLAGPLIGVAAHQYAKMARWARANAPHDARLIPWCLTIFGVIGVITIWLPQLPGNGKGPTELGLGGNITVELAALLLVAKLVATTGTLRAGAEGGLLTPSLAIGALLSVVLGAGWNLAGFAVPEGAYAIVGATAFLGVSMRMPITAMMLTFELTHLSQDFVIPIMAATVGGTAVQEWRCLVCST